VEVVLVFEEVDKVSLNLMAFLQRLPILSQPAEGIGTFGLEPHALHLGQTFAGRHPFSRELSTHILRLLNLAGPEQVFGAFAVQIAVCGVQLLGLDDQIGGQCKVTGMLIWINLLICPLIKLCCTL
jgi:hypothetical protein